MTIPSTLQDIRTKFRRMTAAQSPEQISDPEVDKYINTFYVQDLPEHNRMEALKTTFSFYTQPGVEAYRLGNAVSGPIICPYTQDQILSVEPPVYVNGYEVYFTTSPQQFWRLNPEIRTQEIDVYGDGTIGPFSAVTSGTPILRGYRDNGGVLNPRVSLTATLANNTVVNIVDDGEGHLINQFYADQLGAGAQVTPIPPLFDCGTIDYFTGAYTVTFKDASGVAQIIPSGNAITINYVAVQLSRPVMMLFSQGVFFCRPVPDIGYQIELQAYRTPTALLSSSTQSPELSEWWQMIACGAAMKFFEDNGDFDSYGKYKGLMDNYRRLSARRSLAQISRDRAPTIYSEAGKWPNVGAQFPYYQY